MNSLANVAPGRTLAASSSRTCRRPDETIFAQRVEQVRVEVAPLVRTAEIADVPAVPIVDFVRE